MQTIRDNLATIVAAAVVALVLAASMLLFGPWKARGQAPLCAVVHDGEGGTRRLPLDEPATVEVRTSLGENTIVVEDGSVRIERADCPNGDCTRQRAANRPGEQLICLPHRLWVEVVAEGQDGADAMDVDAVTPGEASGDAASDVDLVAR